MIFSGSGMGGRKAIWSRRWRGASLAGAAMFFAPRAARKFGASRPQSATLSPSTMPQLSLPSARRKLIKRKVVSFSSSAQFMTHEGGACGQGLELAEGQLARQIFHAAIGRRHQMLGRKVFEALANAR